VLSVVKGEPVRYVVALLSRPAVAAAADSFRDSAAVAVPREQLGAQETIKAVVVAALAEPRSPQERYLLLACPVSKQGMV
jgi:hypothetical protein